MFTYRVISNLVDRKTYNNIVNIRNLGLTWLITIFARAELWSKSLITVTLKTWTDKQRCLRKWLRAILNVCHFQQHLLLCKLEFFVQTCLWEFHRSLLEEKCWRGNWFDKVRKTEVYIRILLNVRFNPFCKGNLLNLNTCLY